MADLTPDQKLINLGIKVETVKFGEVTIKELTFEDVQLLAQELFQVVCLLDLDKLQKATTPSDMMVVLSKVIATPEALEAFYAVLATTIGKTKAEMKGLSLKDGMKLLLGFKQSNDLEQVKELFFQLFPVMGVKLAPKVNA